MSILEKALVLYKEQPGIVLESGEKILISLPQNKTQKVREKDFILLSKGPVSNLKSVLDFGENQNSDQELQECYELLDGSSIQFQEACELAWSDCSNDGFWFYWNAFKNSSLFKIEGTTIIPRSKEEIKSLTDKAQAKQKETELRQTFILKLKQNKIHFTNKDVKKNELASSQETAEEELGNSESLQDTDFTDIRFLQEIEALALGKSEKSKILQEAGFSETPESAHKVLLRTGFWTPCNNPYPARWGLSINSSTKNLQQPKEEERLDLTKDERYTAWAIDDESSTDPDDAVCFDGQYFWIHVADPSAGISVDSEADIDARNRGATHYLPEGTARMLPEQALQYYALGLIPVSKALSFRLELSTQGDILETKIFKTLLKVERLSYKKVDEYILNPDLSETATAKALKPLYEFSLKNIERRTRGGAVSIQLPEVHLYVKDGIVNISENKIYRSNALVREMMLIAGEGAAHFAFDNKIPFQFISQEAPEIPKDITDGLAGQFALRKCMHSRQVGITPSAHHGLGLGMYAQVTSPLRRYGDLAGHQQLRLFLDGKPLLDKDTLFEHIAQGDAANVASIKAERESNLHWKLVYLLQNPEWQGEAIVVDFKNKKALVSIPSLAMETLITVPSSTKLNQVFTVKAGNIQLPLLSADFSII